eukprot:PITA_02285
MDVKTAFLYGLLQGEVYVEQPPGFEAHGRKTHVCHLKKSLYRLKQAPHASYARIHNDLMKLGFTNPLILECKRELASEFEMKDLGLMHYFLGLEVWKKSGNIFFSQVKYVVKLLEIFGMVECKSLPTPMEMNFKKLCGEVVGPDLASPSEYRQLVGPLMFLVNTHHDICFEVDTLSQFVTNPQHVHRLVAKHVLRCLHGTINLRFKYVAGNVRLHGYRDADLVGRVVDMKSTSGCCFSLDLQ